MKELIMDFTFEIYKSLLKKLISKYEHIIMFKDYFYLSKKNKYCSIVILRHDVDYTPECIMKMAEFENSLNIKGTYYFRIVPEIFNERIIEKILKLGHEIGYHYEDVDLVTKNKSRKLEKDIGREGIIDIAYESFCENLEKMRSVAEIKTICMHGSPLSKYDNKIIWEKYDYRKLGIIGEPYYDIDFNEFAYFTDTGRKWNGNNVNVRDKVKNNFNFQFLNTKDIINNMEQLPKRLMFTIHPERWNDEFMPWMRQLVTQNMKNIVKRAFLNKIHN